LVAERKKSAAMGPTGASVEEFLEGVGDERRRGEARRVCEIMGEVTGEPARMWGSGIIGFGAYHYRYDSGHEGDAPLVGCSPRKEHLVVYLVGGFEERHASVLARLGAYKAGKGCLYLKRLGDVNEDVLRELIERSGRVHRGVDRAGS
jgi:Domain of unknown function (DU1801)